MRILFLSLLFLLIPSCKSDDDKPIIFIGDSLVNGWDIGRFFPQRITINKGVSGAKINNVLGWNLDTNGKDCVLLIGTNNLPQIKEGEVLSDEFKKTFLDSYENLVTKLNCKKLIVISVLPRSSEPLNKEIKKLNQELKKTLEPHPEVVFLDVFDSFINNGKLNHGYFSDGLHLNYSGYVLLSSSLSNLL